ncbi:MAG: rod shape-determining protein MreC [Bacteroidales bacterium]|nr:rod shape-determining protein MreC [Bacteroidales bacterium]
MRNLINFFIKYNYWFLFLLLEVTSFVLLFRYNNYQQGVFFTSSNAVMGKIYEEIGIANSYFQLRTVNESLLDRNTQLERQVAFLKRQLSEKQADETELESLDRVDSAKMIIRKANVVKNSINQADNYITLDKGSADGIRPEMGVIDAKGVVGIVYKTSAHYALVISLLNSKSAVSCKIAGSEYFGYMRWDQGDSRYAYLKDLPRHVDFNIGDTVVTSGYSAVFPEGIMIGRVESVSDSHDGLSYLLKVRLSTDFGKIGSVRVIERKERMEQNELEKKI